MEIKNINGYDLKDETARNEINTLKTNKADITYVNSASEVLQNNINVEKARIDNLSNLPQGSTSGDAELIDIRIGANGKTYESAGAAVRGQYNEINNNIGNYKLEDSNFDLSNHPLDSFNNECSSGYWGTDYLYNAGYVKSIKMNILGNTTRQVMIIFVDENGYVIHKITENKVGLCEIPVNKYISKKFYILVSCIGLGFKGISTGNRWVNIESNISEDEKITPTFIDGDYKFAFVVNYSNISKSLSVVKNGTKNKCFISGDSIIATYPSYDENISLSNQIGKSLGLEMTRGAMSGNGYLYSSGSEDAKSIANDTDFTKYNHSVWAWGTNDYGNNMELGNQSDIKNFETTKDSSFYGAVAYVVNTILNSNPTINLVLVTPINRSDHGTKDVSYGYGTPNAKGYTLSDYCEAIIKVADEFGIPYVDNRHSPFNKISTPYLLMDNLHPSIKGYKVYGQWLSAQLSQYIKPYVE